MAPPAGQQELNRLVDTTIDLLTNLHAGVVSPSRPPPASPGLPGSTSLPCLVVARDAASLVRAHSTKLSLLIINEPFSPSAITPILRELAASPAQALAAAVQACDPSQYTALVRRELASRCSAVLAELRVLVDKIPRDGRAVPEENSTGAGAGMSAATVAAVLWEVCDRVAELDGKAVAGILTGKVAQWKETMTDVMEELSGWSEEDDEDDEGVYPEEERAGSGGNNNSNNHEHASSEESAQRMIDRFMSSHKRIPRSDPDHLRPRLKTTLRRLRLTTLLFTAVSKRRLGPLPPTLPPGLVDRLDPAMAALEQIPERLEELAMAFYDLDVWEVDRLMEKFSEQAIDAAAMLEPRWEGSGPDRFGNWVDKYKVEMRKH